MDKNLVIVENSFEEEKKHRFIQWLNTLRILCSIPFINLRQSFHSKAISH